MTRRPRYFQALISPLTVSPTLLRVPVMCQLLDVQKRIQIVNEAEKPPLLIHLLLSTQGESVQPLVVAVIPQGVL